MIPSCWEKAEWRRVRGHETESLLPPGCVSERYVGVFAQEVVGACVCAECMTLGRGFIDVRVGGCVQ